MKKTLIIIFGILLSACSSNNDNTENQEYSDFPSKISIREFDLSGNSIDYLQHELFYDNNKLIRISNSNFDTYLTYTDSKLTYIESTTFYVNLEYENEVLANYEIHNTTAPGYEVIFKADLNYDNDILTREHFLLNENLSQDFVYSNTQELRINQGNIFYNHDEFGQELYDFNFNESSSVFRNLNSLIELGIIQTGPAEFNHNILPLQFHFFIGNNRLASMVNTLSNNNISTRNYETIISGNKITRINLGFNNDTNISYSCFIDY